MTYLEILDLIQRHTNTQNSTTSSYPIAAKTVDINNALNQYFILANQSAGNWFPVDDTNQTDYPVIYGNVVSGQNDYSFQLDENGNQILDIYKVRLLQPDGITWKTLKQISRNELDDDYLNPTNTGVPEKYYLTANGIFLINPANYTMVNALEIFINRTSTYFTTTDTTKKAGIPWIFHEYLALRPSYFYCLQKGLPQASDFRVALYGLDGRGGMEQKIKEYYAQRNRDFKRRLIGGYQNNK